jgi:hypothetical protein
MYSLLMINAKVKFSVDSSEIAEDGPRRDGREIAHLLGKYGYRVLMWSLGIARIWSTM